MRFHEKLTDSMLGFTMAIKPSSVQMLEEEFVCQCQPLSDSREYKIYEKQKQQRPAVKMHQQAKRKEARVRA